MFCFKYLKCFLLLLLLCEDSICQPTVFTKQWYKGVKCIADEENLLTTLEFILVEIQRLRYDTKLLKNISAFTKTAVVNVKTDVGFIKAEHIKSTVVLRRMKNKLNDIKMSTGHIADLLVDQNRTLSNFISDNERSNEGKEMSQNSNPVINRGVINPDPGHVLEILPKDQDDAMTQADEIIYVESANNDIDNRILNLANSDVQNIKDNARHHVNEIPSIDDSESDDLHSVSGDYSNEVNLFSGDAELSTLNEIGMIDEGSGDMDNQPGLSVRSQETTYDRQPNTIDNIIDNQPVLSVTAQESTNDRQPNTIDNIIDNQPVLSVTAQESTNDRQPNTIDNIIENQSVLSVTAQESTNDGQSNTIDNSIDNLSMAHQDDMVADDQIAESNVDMITNELISDTKENAHVITDCSDPYVNTSGIFIISPPGTNITFPVYCQLDDGNSRWLVFQRRLNGTVDFYRNWNDYKNGFGKMDGEFWLGNDYLHRITTASKYSLRIDMWDWAEPGAGGGLGKHYFAESNFFFLDNETEFYRMHVPNNFYDFAGFGGSGLRVHAGPFTTYDKCHPDMRTNCAQMFHTGWWFKTCVRNANLNGKYYRQGYAFPENSTRALDGVFWRNIPRSLMKVEMKLKKLV